MPDVRTAVYCDGSVTNAILTSVDTSAFGAEYVARAIVLVPGLDVGLVRQTRDGVLTDHGTIASTQAEEFAIRTALDWCAGRGLRDFVVYNDNVGAVRRLPGRPVEWASREQLYLPNAFFDRILGRAHYLRQSAQRGVRRRPPQPHQVEIFELFNADGREFALSTSALWLRVARDAVRRHPGNGSGID